MPIMDSIIGGDEMFMKGIEFGLDAIGFAVASHNAVYSVGVAIGISLPGVVVGLMIAWMSRRFVEERKEV
jgi:hypothetical protein